MPATFNFELLQGSDKSIVLHCKDKDGNPSNLNGGTASMQVRRSRSGFALIDCLCTDDRIRVNPESGTITLVFDNVTTSKYPVNTLYYDIEFKRENGKVLRLIEGSITVSAEVTRGCRN